MATNVQIPIDNAGIGDAIAIKNGETGEDKSHFICIVGSTVSATAPSDYTWYGSVYGRERGGLMIRSFAPKNSTKWASTSTSGVSVSLDSTKHANVLANSTTTGGTMRNGKTNTHVSAYVAMSVGEVISRNNVSGNSSTALNPTSPCYNNGTWPMNKAKFDLDTNKAKTLYGTYENYIAQLLPLMKGSKSGVFSKRCGKQNTKELALNASTDAAAYTFPAAEYCYGIKIASENANHWWLPDMYELAVMMSDNSFERCQYVHSIIGGNTARDAYRWSSVRSSAPYAWNYYNSGFSNLSSFSNVFTVCPVTLLPL